MKTALLMLATAFACLAEAQTGAIPPPNTRPDHTRRLTEEAAKNAGLAMPGVVMQGSAALHHRMGMSGAAQLWRDADQATTLLSNVVDGARLIDAAGTGGAEGFKTEGAQIILERGSHSAADVLKTIAVRAAIASGAGAVTALGAAGVAYTGGSLVGGWVRDNEPLGNALKLDGTVGDTVDKWWWDHTSDRVKEGISGVRQDFDSREFQRDMEIDIARRRRQAAFSQVQRENAEQQRLATRAAEAASEPGVYSNASVSPSSALFMDQLNLSLRNLQASQPNARASYMTGSTATNHQCTLNPKTGCHSGHDEKSHPGGCKCAR